MNWFKQINTDWLIFALIFLVYSWSFHVPTFIFRDFALFPYQRIRTISELTIDSLESFGFVALERVSGVDIYYFAYAWYVMTTSLLACFLFVQLRRYFDRITALSLTAIIACGPFAFERVLMGQVSVLRGMIASIAAAVWFAHMVQQAQQPRWMQSIAIVSAVSLINIHSGIMLVLGIIIIQAVYNWREVRTRSFFLFVSGLCGTLFTIGLFGFRSRLMNTLIHPDVHDLVRTSMSWNHVDNLWIFGAIGSSSWMFPSFVEYAHVQNIISFHPYVHAISALLVILICVSFVSYHVASAAVAQNSIRLVLLILVCFVSFLLAAGANTPVFDWIIYIPGSYVLRESGKWYILSMMVAVLIAIEISLIDTYSRRLLRRLQAWFLYGIAIQCVILIGSLPHIIPDNNVNETVEFVAQTCNDRTALYIPYTSYISSSFAPTFINNAWSDIDSCNVLLPLTLGVGGDTQYIELETNATYQQLLFRLQQLEQTQTDQSIELLLQELRVQKIEIVIIDIRARAESFIVYQNLRSKTRESHRFGDVVVLEIM